MQYLPLDNSHKEPSRGGLEVERWSDKKKKKNSHKDNLPIFHVYAYVQVYEIYDKIVTTCFDSWAIRHSSYMKNTSSQHRQLLCLNNFHT